MAENEMILMTMHPEEREERKRFLQLGPEDETLIRELDVIFEDKSYEVVQEFYNHLLAFPGAKRFFPTENEVRRVQQLQAEYFRRLTKGDYDQEYFDLRLTIGRTHHRIGLHPKWYLGMYNWYQRRTIELIRNHYRDDPEKAYRSIESLSKLLFLDMGLAIESYIATGVEESEVIIRRQAETVLELSTPVVQLWEGILALPLIGAIDSARALQITETLLDRIMQTDAQFVLIDITGVPVVDTQVANHLMKTIEAARLLGCESVVVGISPQIAQTLVHLGIDLGKVKTFATLRSGLESIMAITSTEGGHHDGVAMLAEAKARAHSSKEG